jgi:hypothetical protein
MAHKRYKAMGDALANQTRPILYSLATIGRYGIQTWGNLVGHSWRASDDIDS